jgi:hypothetical protein
MKRCFAGILHFSSNSTPIKPDARIDIAGHLSYVFCTTSETERMTPIWSGIPKDPRTKNSRQP